MSVCLCPRYAGKLSLGEHGGNGMIPCINGNPNSCPLSPLTKSWDFSSPSTPFWWHTLQSLNLSLSLFSAASHLSEDDHYLFLLHFGYMNLSLSLTHTQRVDSSYLFFFWRLWFLYLDFALGSLNAWILNLLVELHSIFNTYIGFVNGSFILLASRPLCLIAY